MSIFKGDIKKALGFSTITVLGIEIDLSKTTYKDIVDFQQLPILALQGKKVEELTSKDLIVASELRMGYFVDYFKDKSPATPVEDIKLLVVKNFATLQKEFTIGFGIKSRAKYEEDEAKAIADAKEQEKNVNPQK